MRITKAITGTRTFSCDEELINQRISYNCGHLSSRQKKTRQFKVIDNFIYEFIFSGVGTRIL